MPVMQDKIITLSSKNDGVSFLYKRSGNHDYAFSYIKENYIGVKVVYLDVDLKTKIGSIINIIETDKEKEFKGIILWDDDPPESLDLNENYNELYNYKTSIGEQDAG